MPTQIEHPYVFGPDTATTMGEAFNAAIDAIEKMNGAIGPTDPLVLRDIVALKILEAAKGGERDTIRLKQAALDHIKSITLARPAKGEEH